MNAPDDPRAAAAWSLYRKAAVAVAAAQELAAAAKELLLAEAAHVPPASPPQRSPAVPRQVAPPAGGARNQIEAVARCGVPSRDARGDAAAVRVPSRRALSIDDANAELRVAGSRVPHV